MSNQPVVAPSPIPELANSLKRLDFYYECVKRDIEDILLGRENLGAAALSLDELAWELEDVVNDIRNLAHRLREESPQKLCV